MKFSFYLNFIFIEKHSIPRNILKLKVETSNNYVTRPQCAVNNRVVYIY